MGNRWFNKDSKHKAGWHPDPEGADQLRWWDGQQWTEHTHPKEAEALSVEMPNKPQGWNPTRWTYIGGSLILLLALLSSATGGPGAFLLAIAIALFITAIYVFVTKRASWLNLATKKSATIFTILSVVLLGVGTYEPQDTNPVAEIAPEEVPPPVVAEIVAIPEVEPDPGPNLGPEAEFQYDPANTAGTALSPETVLANSGSLHKSTALEVLDSLHVKGRTPKTGYDRKAKFGTPWTDVDDNGCDTRNDILARDLTDVETSAGCRIISGKLTDKYSNETHDFIRGNDTSPLVQIDHIVSLSDAWQKGAQSLTQHQRITFANDPLNLIAVTAAMNSAKSDGDAATWLPPQKSHRCTFVATQISVKATYGLWVTEAEKEAMQRILADCPAQEVPVSPFLSDPPEEEEAETPEDNTPQDFLNTEVNEPAPAPAPAPALAPAPAPEPVPVPAPAPAPAPADVYYKNCTAARNAGAAPVYQGQPGYAKHLDRDGDGVGCE